MAFKGLGPKLKTFIVLLAFFPVITALLNAFLNNSDSFQHIIIVVGPLLYLVAVLIVLIEFVD